MNFAPQSGVRGPSRKRSCASAQDLPPAVKHHSTQPFHTSISSPHDAEKAVPVAIFFGDDVTLQ